MDSSYYRDKARSLGEGLTRRQAEKALKNHLQELDFMKNRIRVLNSQVQYNNYREKVQAWKIEKHHQLHQQIASLKEEVHKISKRESNQQRKKAIRQKLAEATHSIQQDKNELGKEVREQSLKNQSFIANRKMKSLQEKKLLRNEKTEEVKTIKAIQKMNMCMLSEEVTNQLKKLSAREQELIHLNSKSLQASRMRDQQLKGQKHSGISKTMALNNSNSTQ